MYYFPVFTSESEMGEYGESFSKVQLSFPEALMLVRNDDKNNAGIVINAFTDPFVVNREVYGIVEGMESSIEEKTDTE